MVPVSVPPLPNGAASDLDTEADLHVDDLAVADRVDPVLRRAATNGSLG